MEKEFSLPHYEIMLNKQTNKQINYTFLVSLFGIFLPSPWMHKASAGSITARALPETKRDRSKMYINGINLTQMVASVFILI